MRSQSALSNLRPHIRVVPDMGIGLRGEVRPRNNLGTPRFLTTSDALFALILTTFTEPTLTFSSVGGDRSFTEREYAKKHPVPCK